MASINCFRSAAVGCGASAGGIRPSFNRSITFSQLRNCVANSG